MNQSSYFVDPTFTATASNENGRSHRANFKVFLLLLAATTSQVVLCFVHTHFFNTNAATVGAWELCIFTVGILLVIKHVDLSFITLCLLTLAYLFLLALLRSSFDFKTFRDLFIIYLFFVIGKFLGDREIADKILRRIVLLVLLFGFFEMLWLDMYSKTLNVFAYYISQGGVVGVNWASGNTLALNSIRPDGIGRTLLPWLLGSRRISSIFIEPVSLGNFAVITAAWALAKNKEELRASKFLLISALVMMTMADSRYATATIVLLIFMRICIHKGVNKIAILLPPLTILFLIGISLFVSGPTSDSFVGRLSTSGNTLANFGVEDLIGIKSFAINYGDIGYANVLTRFGAPLIVILWLSFWLVKIYGDSGNRFRAYTAVYASLILTVSGTSLFALKTAGVLWFLVGCCAHEDSKDEAVIATRLDNLQLKT